MSLMRPVQVRSSKTGRIEHAEARAVAAAFFDALGHFDGELPALDELSDALEPTAQIEEVDGDETAIIRHDRQAWLLQIAAFSEQRRRAGIGCFFEELEQSMTEAAAEVQVLSVVEARFTRAGDIERVDGFRCLMMVRRVGTRASIVHLRFEGGSALAI